MCVARFSLKIISITVVELSYHLRMGNEFTEASTIMIFAKEMELCMTDDLGPQRVNRKNALNRSNGKQGIKQEIVGLSLVALQTVSRSSSRTHDNMTVGTCKTVSRSAFG